MVDAIVYQSVMQGSQPVQQLGNLVLTGLSTRTETANTDHGRLWGSFTSANGTYSLQLFKDDTKLDLVASGTSTVLGKMELTEANSSGLSGSVNVVQYLSNDTLVVAVASLSVDDDLPLNNLEALADYDPVVGFARFHLDAFSYLKDFVVSRYKSLIWDSTLVDAKAIGKGGYNLSRVINWDSENFVQASANYALAKILERQYIEPGGTWDIRSKEAKNIVKAHLQSIEVRFDTNNDRVEEKARSMAVYKISR